MKILATADIHGDLEKLYQLVEGLDEKPDAVVVAGDLTPFGPKELVPEIKSALDKLSQYVFMIPGNEDNAEVREAMKDFDMHGKKMQFPDATLIGFEGARWIDSGGELFIKYEPVHKILKETKNSTVLVTHVPPFDTEADVLWTGHHVGSPFLRSLIEDYQPDFVVCGHIHESRGIDKIGKTLVINTGAIADGSAAWLDTQTKEIQFIKIKKRGLEKSKATMKLKTQ